MLIFMAIGQNPQLYLLLRACLLIVENCEGETEPLFPHYILRSNQK